MQIVLNGLISGLGIALMALGFQLVYLPTRVFFIGIAGLYSLAPYTYLAIRRYTGSAVTAASGSLIALIGLAILVEWVNHAPLTRKNASQSAHLISSLGIYIVLVQSLTMIWGNGGKTLRTEADSAVHFGPVILTPSQLLMAGVAGSLLVGFIILMRATRFGLRLQALADNPAQFALYGYNINRHRLMVFGLAGLFAGSASLVTAYDIDFHPHMGLPSILLAVVAIITGGRSSFIGPMIAGILLGVTRAGVVWYLSARWQEAVTFAILTLFLLLRPQGLLGRNPAGDIAL